MRFARTQKILTFLLAGVSAAPVILSGEVGAPTGLVFAGLMVAGLFLEPPVTTNRQYRTAAFAAMALVLLSKVAFVIGGDPVARAALEFAVTLLGIKLCSRGRFSDYQQIAVLGLLLLIGATVTTFDLSYGAFFVAFVALAPSVLATAHLRNEMERRFRHDDGPEGREALARLLASKRVISGRFILGGALLALPVLLLTALLFMSFPRFGLGFFGSLSAARVMAGFSSEVEIGAISGERDEETVVMRLEPLSPGSESYPEHLSLKIRGAVFDLYDEGVWRRTGKGSFEPLKSKDNRYDLGEPDPGAKERGYHVLLESMEPPFLFLPEGTGRVDTEPVAHDGIIKPRKLEINHLGIVRYEDDAKIGIRYKIFISGASIPGPGGDNLEYLAVPANLGRVTDLGARLAGEGSRAQRARRIVNGLRRGFRYDQELETLRKGPPKGLDPVEDLLFERKKGTCEHFATAATLMLRGQGIPARLVTGFGGADWNSVGEYYAVKTGSAHAWTEAFIDGRWITLDATPSIPGGVRYEPPSRLAMILDTLRMRWRKHVIGFDASSQLTIAADLSSVLGGTGSASMGEIPWRIPLGLVFAVVFVFAVRWMLKTMRGRARRSVDQRRAGVSASGIEARDIYSKFEKNMARLGCVRPPTRTPLEFLEDVAGFDPGLVPAARVITGRYNEARFGGRALTAGQVAELTSLVAGLRSRKP